MLLITEFTFISQYVCQWRPDKRFGYRWYFCESFEFCLSDATTSTLHIRNPSKSVKQEFCQILMRRRHYDSHVILIYSDSFLNIMGTQHHCLRIHVDESVDFTLACSRNYDALASRLNDVSRWPLHPLVSHESSLILIISKA